MFNVATNWCVLLYSLAYGIYIFPLKIHDFFTFSIIAMYILVQSDNKMTDH
jgi:hypothetical protein